MGGIYVREHIGVAYEHRWNVQLASSTFIQNVGTSGRFVWEVAVGGEICLLHDLRILSCVCFCHGFPGADSKGRCGKSGIRSVGDRDLQEDPKNLSV
jgi:hypothetical protein